MINPFKPINPFNPITSFKPINLINPFNPIIPINPFNPELKIISADKSRYPKGVISKGTDRRAALIPKEYETKLWKYDVKFHGTVQKVSG